MGELVMVAEIARMFGVTRQAVDLWTKKPGFPAPVETLIAGRIWRREDIVRWGEATGRAIHE